MPPKLALVLTLGFIFFLFRRDAKQKKSVTSAIWLPTIWLFIISSRFPSGWLGILGLPLEGASSLEDGSPLDRLIFIVLIALGLRVLARRGVKLEAFSRQNPWIFAFLAYALISIVWSDFPFVALKRWVKVLGHPIMVLILLTEPNPKEAVIVMFKRVAYLLVPLSILFIKYYPQWGRGFSIWSGEAYNMGVTTNKNELGYLCTIVGFFFAWHLTTTWRAKKSRARRDELLTIGVFIAMVWWLISMAHSGTALVALCVGVLVLVFLGRPWVNKRMLAMYLIGTAALLFFADYTLDLRNGALEMLGKDPTLTDRTKLWADVLQVDINPLLGAGFESFWLGDRLAEIWAKWTFGPNQAHNGYIETYVNLGLIGLVILIGVLISSYLKSQRELFRDFQFGRFRIGFFVTVVLYNWTEATFKALHPIWFVFYIVALDYYIPRRHAAAKPKQRVATPVPATV